MKKRVVAAAAASVFLFSLTGCGSAASTDTTAGAVTPASSGEVSWWGWTPDTPVAEKYIAAFNKEYPNIKVTYKNYENVDYRNAITPALESGTGPDVYDISPAGGSPDTWGGFALDPSTLAQQTLGADWKDKFGTGYLQQLTNSDGQLTALPLGGMTAGFLWYNADIFTAAGADLPTDYNSWVAACKKIQAAGKICFTMGAGGEDTFPTEFFHSIANSVDPAWFLKAATGDAKWNDPQGIEVLNIIKKMKDDGIISKNVLDAGQYPLANEEFMRGKAAMVQMGYWYAQYSGLESAKTAMESAGVSNPTPFVQLPLDFPDVAAKGNGSQVFGEADYGLAINKDSKNVGAAQTFVAWMTMSKNGQQMVANAIDLIPGLKGVEPDWTSIKLVDPTRQQPAIATLLQKSASTTQTRQWQTTETTLKAIVVAVQQVLDPTVHTSIEDIAQALQDSSEASTVGK
jgi:ABC-type glycerol-3-phosphate transport system substrate-binding protein